MNRRAEAAILQPCQPMISASSLLTAPPLILHRIVCRPCLAGIAEISMSETTEALPIGAVEGKPGVTLVTQENFDAYVTQELRAKGDIPAEDAGTQDDATNDDPEAVAKREAEALAAAQAEADKAAKEPKEGDTDGSKVFFKGKWKDKSDFGYRLHLKETEAKEAAQAKIDAAEAKGRQAAQEAAKAAEERDALRAKYEPPKSEELGPKPTAADYIKDGLMDVEKFSADVEAWAADKARIDTSKAAAERKQNEERAAITKGWEKSLSEFTTANPDLVAKIGEKVVPISDQLRDEIVASPVGPEIFYHLAENDDEALAIRKMTVPQMLKEFGKLEARFTATKMTPKPEPKAETKPNIELSKAPAPISPLKGSNHGTGVKMDAAGNWTGTFEEYKAARKAGKI